MIKQDKSLGYSFPIQSVKKIFLAMTKQINYAACIIRDKAYTLLKKVVDEVPTVGQYVFWRDQAQLKGYVSRYRKTRRGKSKTTDETVITE